MTEDTPPKSRSKKTAIIEKMFFDHWDADRQELTKSVMTFDDVRAAIIGYNVGLSEDKQLSTDNPANFMKDAIRGVNASRNWPVSLHKLAYTARQTPGEGNVFEFMKYPEGQGEPFPDKFVPSENTPRFPVQSVSLPLHARRLGRSDEPWLIQTAINLKIVETHFAVASKLPVSQLTHLQMSVKLRRTEIDALFLAVVEPLEAPPYDVVVTCEAKGARERVLEHQIVNQVKAAFRTIDAPCVVPIAIRGIKDIGMYVVEFVPVDRSASEALENLEVASTALYELKPPVPGINAARARVRKSRKPRRKEAS